MDLLGGLEIFVRVAHARSFSEAARGSGMTPSAVSRSIARLEHELGARLLHRTTHAVALTETGEMFFERARRIVEDVAEARDAVEHEKRAPRGTLRVDAPIGFGRLAVAPLVPAFLARHPDVRVEMSLRDHFVDPVADRIDVAVRVGEPKDTALVARKLADGRMLICGAPGYLRKRGTPRTAADLADHDCLGFLRAGRARPWHLAGGTVEPRGRLASDNAELLRDAAVAGVGLICLLEHMVARDLADGALRIVLDGEVVERRPVYALHAPHRQPSPKVRAFIDHLVATLGRA